MMNDIFEFNYNSIVTIGNRGRIWNEYLESVSEELPNSQIHLINLILIQTFNLSFRQYISNTNLLCNFKRFWNIIVPSQNLIFHVC